MSWLDQPGGALAILCVVIWTWSLFQPATLPAKPNGLPPEHDEDPAGSNAWEAQWQARSAGWDRAIWTQRVGIAVGILALMLRYGCIGE